MREASEVQHPAVYKLKVPAIPLVVIITTRQGGGAPSFLCWARSTEVNNKLYGACLPIYYNISWSCVHILLQWSVGQVTNWSLSYVQVHSLLIVIRTKTYTLHTHTVKCIHTLAHTHLRVHAHTHTHTHTLTHSNPSHIVKQLIKI